MIKPPRTLADFRFIENLARSGYDNKTIARLYSQKTEWRSVIFSVWDKKHCAVCTSLITLHECLSCGQTIYKEGN